MTREELVAKLYAAGQLDPDEDNSLLLADGFEDAFAGILERFGMDPIAVYDRAKCIEVLMTRDGMTAEEAEEYFSFNVTGAWVGKQTPAYLIRLDE